MIYLTYSKVMNLPTRLNNIMVFPPHYFLEDA